MKTIAILNREMLSYYLLARLNGQRKIEKRIRVKSSTFDLTVPEILSLYQLSDRDCVKEFITHTLEGDVYHIYKQNIFNKLKQKIMGKMINQATSQ